MCEVLQQMGQVVKPLPPRACHRMSALGERQQLTDIEQDGIASRYIMASQHKNLVGRNPEISMIRNNQLMLLNWSNESHHADMSGFVNISEARLKLHCL